jgi:hypothetical protein
MGGFGVPGFMPSRVLSGAVSRYREIQKETQAEEENRRKLYVNHLGQLMDSASDGETVQQLSEEITRTLETPLEKPFKPRPLKPPSFAQPGGGQPQQGQQGQQGQQSGGGSAVPFDFRAVMEAITGQGQRPDQMPTGASGGMPAGAPQSPSGAPDSISAVPPDFAAIAQQRPEGVFAGAVPSLTPTTPLPGPGALPSVAAPQPGKSAPEPSPLIGTLPGAPTPPAFGPQTQTAATTPPPMPMASAATGGPQHAAATPPPMFMGLRDKARLPYEMMQEFGLTRTGKPITPGGAGLQQLPTIKDVISAAKSNRRLVEDPDSPTGWSAVPMTMEDLTLTDQSKLASDASRRETDVVRREDIKADNIRADELLKLKETLGKLDAARKSAKTSRDIANIDFRRTMEVSRSYERATKWYNERDISLNQAISALDKATGVGDYVAILSTVHAIDNTAAREGEVKTVRAAASLKVRLEQLITRFREGDLLAPQMRAEFKSVLDSMIASHQQARADIDEKYAYQTYKYMLDPKATGTDSITPTPSPSGGGGSGSGSPRLSKQQRNPRTGATRTVYSDDGGRTWHP